MKALYLLRRSIDRVETSVFLPSQTEGDVVLLEEGVSSGLSHSTGEVFSVREGSSYPYVSYDEIIEKIFTHDCVIVI